MAHELGKRGDGSAATFSVGETPWHRLGAVLNRAPTSKEALALAGADFQVELRPLFANVADSELSGRPRMVPFEGRYATVRLDTHRPLGVVTRQYTPLQNDDAFHILDSLIDEQRVTLETGGVLRDGADVWIMAKFELPRGSSAADFLKREKIDPYFLLANNHSGRRGVLCSLTPIRVVCANTLGMVEDRARSSADQFIRVRHTRLVEDRVREAANELMNGIIARLDAFAKQQQTLKDAILPKAEWSKTVLDELAPLPAPPRSRSGQPSYERNLKRSIGRRDRLTWLWEHGPGHEGTGSAWEAYQAVTHSLDHDDDQWLVKTPGHRRLASLLDGHLAELKSGTLRRLFEFAQKHSRSN